MNYWHMQLHPTDSKTITKEVVAKILREKSVIGLGKWKNGEIPIRQFKNDVKLGDIIAIKRGGTPIALVKINGEYWLEEEVDDSFDWFPHRRKVEVLDFYKESYGFNIPQKRGTLSICKDLSTPTSQTIINWYKMSMKNESVEKSVNLLEQKHQIILQGPPGTGKTYQAKKIAAQLTDNDNDKLKLIQFHPAYTYEDFVRGIVAKPTENGGITYEVKNKILAELAQRAKGSPNSSYVLIIDEINRANLPAVLGELIYALEYRGEPVTSMYEYDKEREIILPKNLYIIGTMNTADRSVGHIDYAIRRRFAFVDVLPDRNVIEHDAAKQLFDNVQELFTDEFLTPDFNKDDVAIGHSYFLVKDDNELKIRLKYEIKPILKEYLKDGILMESAVEKIENLNV